MNVWWENLIQIGIPILIIFVPIVLAIIIGQKRKQKEKI